jgi:putative ABC transport system permease protein
MDAVRYAWRMLRKAPSVTAMAMVTLALGIGGSSAIFSVVDAVMLRPLGYREPARLVTITNLRDGQPLLLSQPESVDYREQAHTLAGLTATLAFDSTLEGGDEAERVRCAGTFGNYFELLGVPAAIGRTYENAEEQHNYRPIAVISHGLWQRRFGGGRDVVGRTLRIDGDNYTIIGVMPREFRHPDAPAASPVDVWMPTGWFGSTPPTRGAHMLDIVARVRPGVGIGEAQTELATIQHRLKETYRESFVGGDWRLAVAPLEEQVVGGARRSLLVLLAAVAVVLLIACSNVACLLLSRMTVRRREMATRKALGATDGQLVRQLLVESVMLSLGGGVVGLALAVAGVRLLVAFAPAGLPRVHEIHVDAAALAFNFTVAVLAGLLFGTVPALVLSRTQPYSAIREGAALGGSRRNLVLRALVVGEFALALVLLTSAGLLLRSLSKAVHVDPGFDPHGRLGAHIWLPMPNNTEEGRYNSSERIRAFETLLLQRLGAVPGVESAALASGLPLGGDMPRFDVQLGVFAEAGGQRREPDAFAWSRWVSSAYFQTMGIPIREGRSFVEEDGPEAPRVAVVGEKLARALWPGQSAVGKRFRVAPGGGLARKLGTDWYQVIGVAADVRLARLDAPPPEQFYACAKQVVPANVSIVLRGPSRADLTAAVRDSIHGIDRGIPIYDVADMETVLAKSIAPRRFTATLLALFAGVALLLATLGNYGVMAYAVSQQGPEIAVRMALGAQERDIVRMIVLQSVRMVATSILVGMAGVWAVTRLIQSLLYDVALTDPQTHAAIVALLVGVAVVASWLPARRAARTSPIAALHCRQGEELRTSGS